MTVAAISMVKDEIDVVEASVRRMAGQVDLVIIADNGSSDGTREILDRLAGELELTVLDDPEVGYFQSAKMTQLAQTAAQAGADWVVAADLDEVWHARDGRLADVLTGLPAEILVAEAALYDHVATALDPPGDPMSALGWRRPYPGVLPKVACRALPGLTIAQGNHGATYEHTDHPATVKNLLTVPHFPYRSPEQVIRKVRNGAAAYAATDLPEELGAHWRQWGRILAEHGEDAIRDLFHTWFYRELPDQPLHIGGEEQPPLVYDPLP